MYAEHFSNCQQHVSRMARHDFIVLCFDETRIFFGCRFFTTDLREFPVNPFFINEGWNMSLELAPKKTQIFSPRAHHKIEQIFCSYCRRRIGWHDTQREKDEESSLYNRRGSLLKTNWGAFIPNTTALHSWTPVFHYSRQKILLFG